ncbi:MAG: hypothetical protein QM777_08735 [Pseudorhodoferax sp.]
MTETISIGRGLRFAERPGIEIYTGKMDALLAAGLVKPHQIPGGPGMAATCASFHADGRRVVPGDRKASSRQGYLRIEARRANRWRVTLCVDASAVAEAKRTSKHRAACGGAALAPVPADWPFPLLGGTLPSLASGAGAAEARLAPGVPAAMLRASNGGSAGIGRRAAAEGAAA